MVSNRSESSYQENLRRIRREIAEGVVDVRSFPYEISVSSEHRCQLRCIMCKTTAERKRGVIPLSDRPLPENTLARFKKLEPQMACWRQVMLTGSGETLMCPDLPEILAMSRRHGVFSSLATNALLIDQKRAEMLIGKGLDEIAISIDGACKETYEKIRIGARWEDLMEAIETLNRVKSALKSKTPHIYFSGNFTRYNIEELPDLVDFAAAHGGTGFYAFKTVLYDSDLKKYDLSFFPELTWRMYVDAARRAWRSGLFFGNWLVRKSEIDRASRAGTMDLKFRAQSYIAALRHRGPKKRMPLYGREQSQIGHIMRETSKALRRISKKITGRQAEPRDPVSDRLDPRLVLQGCRHPWTGLFVASDGSVRVCCAGSILLGNIDEQSFDDIWNGEPARALRRLFLEGRVPEGCRRCPELTKTNELETSYAGKALGDVYAYMDTPEEGDVMDGAAPVSGWILDPAGQASLEIFINGFFAGKADCGLERPDVIRAHPGCGENQKPGFSYRLDTKALKDGYHLLSVRTVNPESGSREIFHRTVIIRNNGAD